MLHPHRACLAFRQRRVYKQYGTPDLMFSLASLVHSQGEYEWRQLEYSSFTPLQIFCSKAHARIGRSGGRLLLGSDRRRRIQLAT